MYGCKFSCKTEKTLIITTLRDAMPQQVAVQNYELYAQMVCWEDTLNRTTAAGG